MSFTAKEVEEKLSAFGETEEYQEIGYGSVYEYIKSEQPSSLDVPGLGVVKFEDGYGGEGGGDEYWVVFQVGDQYFRVDGYYASYDGGELDGDPYEVEKVPTTGFDYRRK